jgi:hypothetical protein
MSIITIPKKYLAKTDLVGVPRREYEEFVSWRKAVREFMPNAGEKRDLRTAREDYKEGIILTLHEFKQKLASRNKSQGVADSC